MSVRVETASGVSWIHLDDGKANVLSSETLDHLGQALDEAEARNDVVVIKGRPGVLSAGFDLAVLKDGLSAGFDMIMSGFQLALRLLNTRRPVVIACTGHAIAMGAFLTLVADHRVGIEGDFRIEASEVRLGMVMPHTPIALLKNRLAPAAFVKATVLAHAFDPISAVQAGFLDELVSPEAMDGRIEAVSEQLKKFDPRAFGATKKRALAVQISDAVTAIEADQDQFLKIISRNKTETH